MKVFSANVMLSAYLMLISSICIAHENSQNNCLNNSRFNVGAGIYDITGPAAEEGMMGYALLNQKTSGILQRLWARAFVIESACNKKRVVFVNADLGQMFQGIKQQVIIKLHKKYGNLYNDDNVLLTAIHSHSGPGGYSTYALYNLTTLGFNRKNFNTIIDGIVASIERAHKNMQPAFIKYSKGDLSGLNHNRSPQSYKLNPKSERNNYRYNTDTEMSLIRFDGVNGKPIGLINWFPVHGVSMNNKNKLINGDNKGYAEYLFEKDYSSNQGPHSYVAAFAQANAGDVSPNPYGHEGGVGIIGIKKIEHDGGLQYRKAKYLFKKANEKIIGGVDYRHEFIKMDNVLVEPKYANGVTERTCTAAIGVSMLAGTQDGKGYGKQGVKCADEGPLAKLFTCSGSAARCQGVKPIAIETGSKNPPWTANILPLQVIKIGQLVIVAAPVEATTMSGRRIIKTVTNNLKNPTSCHVVISTLANAYAGYLTTFEEYQLQRYEGASTHFGPWELSAFQQEYAKLTYALENNLTVSPGPTPKNLSDKQENVQTGVVFDDKPFGKQFGDVYKNVKQSYKRGETVKVIFWGGHPKNSYHTQGTFFKIQHKSWFGWSTVKNDNDWDTAYYWKRNGIAFSLVTIEWRIPKNQSRGKYRIVHSGEWKSGWNSKIHSYTGQSAVFVVR